MPSLSLGLGQAAVIMTGAPLPAEADAVVMREHSRTMQAELIVEIAKFEPVRTSSPEDGFTGQQDILLQSGNLLNPSSLGLLASVGRSRVRVIPKPTLAILPTGDELVEPALVPGPGQIRNSNAVMLEALPCGRTATAPRLPDRPRRDS